MNLRLILLIIFAGFLGVQWTAVYGADQPVGSGDAVESSPADSGTAQTIKSFPTQTVRKMGSSLNASPNASLSKRYKRSKVTYDQAEGLADKRSLLLTSGEDKAVDLDFDANMTPAGISYGNPQIVSATLAKIGDRKQVVFKPLKAGETTVTIRDVNGDIGVIFVLRVTGSNLLRVKSELIDLLRDIEGVSIRVVGAKVVVEGEVLVPADYGRLFAVISDKTYVDFVLNLTTLSPMAMQFLASRIQTDISAFAPSVKTRVVNGMIFLEGTVNSLDESNRANRIANFYLPDIKPSSLLEKDVTAQRVAQRALVQNFIMVLPPPPRKMEKLVRVTVHFVELAKDYNKVFGFKWQPGFTSDPYVSLGQGSTGAAAAGGGTLSFGGTISSLLPKLDSLQAAGYARVLKTGTVIVRSGQDAKITELTQFPFMSASGTNGQMSAQSKDVGLTVAVTPLILGTSEDIQMDMNVEQTDLVGRAPTNGGPPTTAKHTVATKIYVKSNESAAIAGIAASDIGTDFNKDDPSAGYFGGGSGGAQTIPVFSLLHSKAYRKKKTNFVVFVTPQIIENASEGTEDLKKNFRVRVN